MNIKILLLLLAFFSSFNTIIAQETKVEKKAKEEAKIAALISAQRFIFKAQTAIPSGAKTRSLNSDWDVFIAKDTVVSYLPYYGRAYSATYGSTSSPLDFTSHKFEYKIEPRKKGGWDITINFKDVTDARQFSFSISESGYGSLYVTLNNRSSISFNGYIEEKVSSKKK